MKKYLLAAGYVAMTLLMANAASSDPVLMKINGKEVPVSEFEYLYNKNNSQQQTEQSLDDYLPMFIDYKLKVADAEAQGLDQTEQFAQEFKKFRGELAAPYFVDKSVEDALIAEAYNHRLSDVLVSHIMFAMKPGAEQRADSVRNEILAGNISFEDAARQFSVDSYSAARGGLMGYVTPDRFPYPFEKAAYNTAKGELSPVVNSGLGYHIIRVESVNPSPGEVHAAHILLMTRGVSPEQAEANKVKIDSIYNVLAAGGDFAKLAAAYSQDGSAQRGGDLGYFGRGQMVAEFDSVSFALSDGEISRPFKTMFGYHIVKRIDHKGIAPLDSLMPAIKQAMSRDERSKAPAEAGVAAIISRYKGALNPAGIDRMAEILRASGRLDTATVAAITAIEEPAATYESGVVSFPEVMVNILPNATISEQAARDMISDAAYSAMREATLDLARDMLMLDNADYRNLINEYRDGILLYEVANRNVWDRAAKDTEGLKAFFDANKSNYKWESPKFKSYIIFATNDSILDEAMKFAPTLSTDVPAEFTQAMHKRFGRDIKVERVIAAKGENAITDYLGFGAEKPAKPASTKWIAYKAYKGRILDAPEEPADVRGAAVTDYQAKLEADWVKQLHDKYPVKVNNKIFKQLKKRYTK